MRMLLPKLSIREDVAGLDIGDGYIAAARVSRNGIGRVEVKNAGWREINPDASDGERIAAIRSLWRSCHMPTNTVCSCLRSRSAAIKPFRFTGVSSEELASAIQIEAEDVLQTDANRFYLDWYINGRERVGRNETEGAVSEGLFVATLREEVDRYLRLMQRAGVYPIRLNVAPVAVANLFLQLDPAEFTEDTLCLVNLTSHWADMVIIGPGPFLYVRSVFSVTETWGCAIPYLVQNLADVLEYYQRRLRRDPVQKVLFTGLIPDRETYGDILTQALGIPVGRWNPLEHATLSGPAADTILELGQEDGSILSTSLGLALWSKTDG